MVKYTRILSIFVLLIATQAWAGVGLTEKVFTDTQRDRKLTSYIWYPSQAGHQERFAENIVFTGFDAVKDGEIKPGKYPLYILLHGTSGNWRNLSWLAAKLAADGGVVVAANHPGYTSGNATPGSVIRAWNQPKDASFLLSQLLNSGFKQIIDASRVYAIGYSLGGYSTLALAGARSDMRRLVTFCDEHDDAACRYFKPTFPGLDKTFYYNIGADLSDERFKRFVAITPGFVETLTHESLGNITAPTMIIGAEHDRNLPPATHFAPYKSAFSPAIKYNEVEDAAHFSFMQICKPGGIDILAEDGEEFVCLDGNGASRKTIHEQLYRLVTDFLHAQ